MKRTKYDKYIAKHKAKYKEFVPSDKMLEVLSNPSPEKWSTHLIAACALEEFSLSNYLFWQTPNEELLQRIVDALHILYISFALELKNEGQIVSGSIILPSYMLSMYIFAEDSIKANLIDITTASLQVEKKILNQSTTWMLVKFLYEDILKAKAISWDGYLKEPTIELYDRVLSNISNSNEEEMNAMFEEMMDFHMKKASVESFSKNPFYDPLWRVFPAEVFALLRYRYINGIIPSHISDDMLRHYAPYLQNTAYPVSSHIEQTIKELDSEVIP